MSVLPVLTLIETLMPLQAVMAGYPTWIMAIFWITI
jgi:hypothetical protein